MACLQLFILVSLFYLQTVLSNDVHHLDCTTLLPLRKTVEKDNSAFKLTASSKTARPGQTLHVSLHGKRFRQFMIQARHAVRQTQMGLWAAKGSLRACHHPNDTLFSDDYALKTAVHSKWRAPVKAGYEAIVLVASVIDEDGKAYKLQSGPILEADPVKPTTAEPDQDEESEDEDGRRPGEEQEQPATPNETKPTKPTEDPNAYEKEEERRRQESLRRDREGDEASTKKPAAGQDEGEVEEGRVDPEEEEEEGHKEEEDEEEVSNADRVAYETRKSEEANAARERIHAEIRQMEEESAREEHERRMRIQWEEEDFKLHQLMMKRKLEKEKKEKEELDKMTPEEVLVNDDNLIVKDMDGSGSNVVASLATISCILLAFLLL